MLFLKNFTKTQCEMFGFSNLKYWCTLISVVKSYSEFMFVIFHIKSSHWKCYYKFLWSFLGV